MTNHSNTTLISFEFTRKAKNKSGLLAV